MHLGADHCSEGVNLGSKVLFEVLCFGVDVGMHVFIDSGNISTELSHFLLGFYEIRVQGIEVSFQVLATGVGHDEEGTRKGVGGTTQKMGYGEVYLNDQGNDLNPMG
jgi:hypothetical protein